MSIDAVFQFSKYIIYKYELNGNRYQWPVYKKLAIYDFAVLEARKCAYRC